VCGAPALLALDKQLSDLFDALLAKTAPAQRPAVYDDERKWLREMRGPCAQDETCLLRVYKDRIAYFTWPAKKE
jgi:uncharacterized protein